jgi:hypothetical protein
VRLPVELGLTEITKTQNEGHYAIELRKILHKAHQVAREHLINSAVRQKHRYDSKAVLEHFHPGDLLLVLNEKREVGVCPKLQPVFLGPFVVTKKINDWLVEVQTTKDGNRRILHHDKIKKYLGDEIPKWANNLSKKVKSANGSSAKVTQQ